MLLDPEVVIWLSPLMTQMILPSGKSKPSATPNRSLFGAQSLQLTLTACNVSYLRLTCYITGTNPRLDCAESALSRRSSQPPVQWRFRGAPTLAIFSYHALALRSVRSTGLKRLSKRLTCVD